MTDSHPLIFYRAPVPDFVLQYISNNPNDNNPSNCELLDSQHRAYYSVQSDEHATRIYRPQGGQVACIDWPEGIIHVANIMSRPMLMSEFVPLSQDGTSPLYRMMHFDNSDYTWISYNGIITVARRQRAQRIQASDLICRVEHSTEGIFLKVYEEIGVYLLDAVIAVSLIYLRQSSGTAVN